MIFENRAMTEIEFISGTKNKNIVEYEIRGVDLSVTSMMTFGKCSTHGQNINCQTKVLRKA